MMERTNCLVVACAEWASIIPKWLLTEIEIEREAVAFRSVMQDVEPHEKVGDAEALAYLMTLGQRTILSSGWVKIYEHLTRELLSRRTPGVPAVSEDMHRTVLNALEAQELRRLKTQILEQRGDITHPLYSLEIRK